METLLNQAGKKLAAQRRPFDVGTGLRRLAEDAGYVAPSAHTTSVPHARQQLSVVVRWVLHQPTAATHMEQLAEAIGADGPEDGRGPLRGLDIDIEGAQVFACMLHLADHPESAQFWWQLAAGAGHPGAAYCLHLHHVGRGEMAEARLWRYQLEQILDALDDGVEDADAFVTGMGQFAAYVRRHYPPADGGPGLTAEVERLASLDDEPVLVCRPEREIADRLQHCAAQRP
ncbi:hypothetical protein [Streptomyces alboflavus]|uniref:hypothetical protein n=1 Tax=Streptomyces alboflavus TaxID=67267 RepID=UPI001F01C47C|nr:hypothetical protein [Streptomyces alboflavus]